MAFYVDNAISWAQLRIRGGWRNLLAIAAVYACVAAFVITLCYQLAAQPIDKRNILYAASIMLTAVQVVMVLFLTGGIITGAIRRDILNRQIESNRLMPMQPVQSIIGYIAGASAHILALCIVNLLLGAILALFRNLPVADWFMVNAILLAFSVSIWSAMAMAAFISRAILGLMFAICFGIGFSGGFISLLIPALLVYCTPMQNRTIFQSTSFPRLTAGIIVGILAQSLFSLLFIRGAARKYVDTSARALPLGPSLAILGIWAALSWFGISQFREIRPETLLHAQFDWRIIIVGGIASSLLVALLPLSAVAASNAIDDQRRLDGEHPKSRAWVFWLCLPVCLLFALLPLTVKIDFASISPGHRYARHADLPMLISARESAVTLIACACAIYLFGAYWVMRLCGPRLRLANLVLTVATVLTWFGPLFADLIYAAVEDIPNPTMDHVSLLSPLGTITQSMGPRIPNLWTGVLAQALIAILPAAFFLLRHLRAQRIAAHISHPATTSAPTPTFLPDNDSPAEAFSPPSS